MATFKGSYDDVKKASEVLIPIIKKNRCILANFTTILKGQRNTLFAGASGPMWMEPWELLTCHLAHEHGLIAEEPEKYIALTVHCKILKELFPANLKTQVQ